MKLTSILLLVACLQVSASGKAQSITLSVRNSPLENLFKTIQRQTGYSFIYTRVILQDTKNVTVSVKGEDLEKVLNEIFNGQPLSFTIVDKYIVIKRKLSTIPAPQTGGLPPPTNEVTGTVKSENGEPLNGATVTIKKLGRTCTSNEKGEFVLQNVPNGNYQVEISFVGYEKFTSEIVVSNNTPPITVGLKKSKSKLDEVVITALGISKSERKLGYAITTVDGTLLNEAKEPNVANSLEGRVAGLSINSVNGGPGSSARILIRGISNFSSGTVGPLIVLNGVPMDNTNQGAAGTWGGSDMGDGISSINPDDIENVTVLKGSTASALYGSRASNGVIQITTKSGNSGRGVGVEFSSNFYVNQIINNSDYQKQYGAGQNGNRPLSLSDLTNDDLNSWGQKFDGAPSIAQDGKMHPYSPVSNPWNKFYRTAPVTTNTIAFTHSDKNGNLRFSLSQTDNESVMPNSNLKRYSGNLNLHQNITEKLKLSLMANFINENVKNRPYLNDFSRNANFIIQYMPTNISPDYLKPGWDPLTMKESVIDQTGYYGNPWFSAYKLMNNTTRNRFLTSTSLKYDFTQDLYAQARLGLDYISDGEFEAEPTGWGISSQGKLEDQMKQETTELNIDGLIGYNHNFTDKISINTVLGGNIRKFKRERVGFNNQNFAEPFLYTVANSVGLGYDYQFSQLQTNSAYYTVDISRDRYLTLSTTGRYDVFSTLPSGQRGIFTPSVSASFLFNDLLHIPKMSLGKLRLSYAQTSGEALPYHTQITYQPLGSVNGIPYGVPQSFVFNPSAIKPYTMKEFEAGMELKLFQSRLGVNATYFNRRTNGELVSQPVSPSSGYNSSYFPIGATTNKGIELEIKGTPFQNKGFSWNINFNFSYITNKLVSIGDTGKLGYIELDQYRPANGGTVWPGDGSFVAHVQGLPLSQLMVSDYKHDAKGDIIVNNGIPIAGDFKPAGSGLPKIYGGINNEFHYNRFSLAFLIDYRFKVKVLSGTNFITTYYGLNKNTLPGREGGILFKGVNTDGSTNTTTVNAQTYYQTLINNVSIINVLDASFIKLRQVSFGYEFPFRSGEQRNPFQSIKVSLVGRNLWTILKHTPNLDPEANYSSLPVDAGLEGGNLPAVRSYGINLNFRFK
ncbi:MAG TPA: SusC/RagA family TonB-linked outer membrane protein [Puia sp.]|nr:SusC/RagA family TonB-linked outer membrane protein [Puia sp.]